MKNQEKKPHKDAKAKIFGDDPMDPKNGTTDYRKKEKTDEPIFGAVPEIPHQIEPIIEAIVESKPTFIPTILKRKMVKQIEPLA